MTVELNKISKRLLTVHGFFISARGFFDIFLGLYIWKLTNDLSIVAWFNIVYLMSHTITFTVFAGYIKKGHLNAPRIWGHIGIIFTFLAIALLGEKTIDYLLPIALLIGLFNGLYWLNYHILRFDQTDINNRTKYTGIEKALGAAVAIIIPALGGYIITANYFGFGYANVFIASVVFFAISLFFGIFKINNKKSYNSYNLKNTWSKITQNKDIMKSMWSWAFSGFARSGSLYKVLLPLFLFEILNNEFHLGGWLSVFAATSILVALSLGKYLKFSDYKKTITIGGALLCASTISLIVFPVFIVYLIYGIIKEISASIINIPRRVISENLIHEIEDYANHRIEYIVIREWFVIAFGRVPSYILLLFVTNLSSLGMQLTITLMSLVVIAEVMILRSIKLYSK